VKFAVFCASLVVIGVVAELVVPGSTVYHAGWYNVAIAALLVAPAVRTRRVLAVAVSPRARLGTSIAAFGVAIVAFAGVASGLLGPDAHSIVGAPGQRVPIAELGGDLRFPLHDSEAPLALVRGTNVTPIQGRRYVGSFMLYDVPRNVVLMEVADTHGARLTITQPTGSAFLSPVLLMQRSQMIAGFDLPFDEFAVPAAHRIVHAVLFSASQAAQLHQLGASGPVVLFDVEDETGTSVPRGIGIAPSGTTAEIAGLRLHPDVFTYPAVGIVSIPNLPVVAVGLLALAGGIVLGYRPR
jgi:hypothetical protein